MALTLSEKSIKLKTTQNCSCSAEFVSYIFTCRNVAHMLHLNRQGPGAYAAHKALDSFYSDIIGIVDSIAEVTMGYNGDILRGYKDYPFAAYEGADPITYLKEAREYIRQNRYQAFPANYSPIQNELDNLENLFNSTIYKLEQLK